MHTGILNRSYAWNTEGTEDMRDKEKDKGCPCTRVNYESLSIMYVVSLAS